jgi:hypothetical protein
LTGGGGDDVDDGDGVDDVDDVDDVCVCGGGGVNMSQAILNWKK